MAKLYFYYSAMNAGKSTNLLQSNYNYHERGMGTLLFTPKLDNRFASGVINSRIGLNAEALAFTDQTDLLETTQRLNQDAMPKIACVLIDEAQFLSKDQVYQLTEIVDKLNIPVLAYGLRTDFLGNLFPGSQYLLAWADEMVELKTICHCGHKASMNARINEQGQAVTAGSQVMIGGNDTYLATCRTHFKAMHAESQESQSAQFDHISPPQNPEYPENTLQKD